MKRERRRARGLALQVLYEVDSVGHPPQEVISHHLENTGSLSEDALAFMQRSVQGALAIRHRIRPPNRELCPRVASR